MGVQRSSFYNWKKTLENPSERTKTLMNCVRLFSEYHARFPSHDSRWLNARLKLDTGMELTDAYAQKCCKTIGVRSRAKHYRYRKSGESGKLYPNLLLSEMKLDGPDTCLVGNALPVTLLGKTYTLSVLQDLWNYEVVSATLTLGEVTGNTLTPPVPEDDAYSCLLQGSACALYAKESFATLLPMYSIPLQSGLAGMPSETAAMDAINSWLRMELEEDLEAVAGEAGVLPDTFAATFQHFFNAERPMYALGYLTPQQYREQNLTPSASE